MATLLRQRPDSLADAKIFVVDDEAANIRLLKKILARAGYKNLSVTTDSRQVASILADDLPDLLLLDLHMPYLNGYQVLELLPKLIPKETILPVIVLTADITPKAKHRALGDGASDFLTKPFDSAEVILRVENALRIRFLHRQLQDQNSILEERVQDRTALLNQSLEELRRTQQQVVQQERLRALGLMATGVAHDFNNVLSLIMGYSELLLNDTNSGRAETRTTRYLQTMIAAAQDAAEMVNRLAQFHRPPSEADARELVNLSQLIEQAVALTMPRWKGQSEARGIDINIDLKLEAVPNITGDPAELREVLTNLIFNAVDAMPQGGTICLRTRSEGQFVILQIEDPEPLPELDEIAKLAGVDMLFFGPGDFSQAIGAPFRFDDPRIDQARRRVAKVARKHGKFAGTVGNAKSLPDLLETGYQFISIGADVIGLGDYFRSIVSSFAPLKARRKGQP